MPDIWKIAGVQFDCKRGAVALNLEFMVAKLRATAAAGARLTVFPECALAGYCFDSKAEALPFAETIPGRATDTVQAICNQHNNYTLFGMLEREGEDLFNSAVLIGPEGVIGSYRKTHLPFLGVDRYVTPGNRPYQVYEIDGLRLGVLICFDGSFPEAPRILALLGADLIVLPTNWPQGARCSADHIPPMRAHENHVYFMAVNRVGDEGGFKFIGQSRVTDWNGQDLAIAPEPREAIVYAQIDPSKARQKRVVFVPGAYEVDRIAGRRPELYGPLVERKSQ